MVAVDFDVEGIAVRRGRDTESCDGVAFELELVYGVFHVAQV